MPLIFVLASEPSLVEDVVAIFNQTVMSCGQKHNSGLFGLSSRFIFFIGKDTKRKIKKISETVFGHKYFQNSAYVAIAKETEEGSTLFYNYNFYNPNAFDKNLTSWKSQYGKYQPSSVSLKFRLEKSKSLSHISNIFTNRKDFQGMRFRVGPLVWSHCVVKSPNNENYYGFEIEMLKSIGKVLNFSYEVILPKSWNAIVLSDDKLSFHGVVPDVAYGASDIAMGSAAILSEVFQLVDSTVRIDGDVYTLAAPNSKPITKLFATIRPFNLYVWIALCGTFIISVAAFIMVSKAEDKKKDINLNEWRKLTSAFFFCYRTLLSESVSQTSKLKNSVHATRYSWPLMSSSGKT